MNTSVVLCCVVLVFVKRIYLQRVRRGILLFFVWSILSSILLCTSKPVLGKDQIISEIPVIAWDYKGISLTGYWNSSFDSPYVYRQLTYYKSLGVNSVEIVPTWYQKSLSSTKIAADNEKTVSDISLIKLIKYAKNIGLSVNLKPHIDPFPNYIEKISKYDFDRISDRATENEKEKLGLCYAEVGSAYNLIKLDAIQKKECRDLLDSNEGASRLFWRASIRPKTEKDVEKWFVNYANFLLHYLDIAIQTDVDIFTVGTELVAMAQPEHIKHWTILMSDLRDHVKSQNNEKNDIKFLYAAHEYEIFGIPNEWQSQDQKCLAGDGWDGKLFDIRIPKIDDRIDWAGVSEFWSLFDYVGMTVYFELGEKLTHEIGENPPNTTGEKDGRLCVMNEKWLKRIDKLSQWREKLGQDKDVIFVEIGYRSINYGQYKPYKQSGPAFSQLVDQETDYYNGNNQANSYSSMLTSLANVSWLKGVYLWQEEVKNRPIFLNSENTTYSLIGKPAARVVESAFTQTPIDLVPSRKVSTIVADFTGKELADIYDFQSGGDFANSSSRAGAWGGWVKGRVRPLSLYVPTPKPKKMELGMWFSVANGGGQIPVFDSDYEWQRVIVGPTIKFKDDLWDWDIDLGIGEIHEDSSSNNNRYLSDQEDQIFYGFSHIELCWRDIDGSRFTPKTSLDLEFVAGGQTEQKRSWDGQLLSPAPVDKRRVELTATQDIYDFSPFYSNKFRFTPKVIFKYGREFEESYFNGIGAGITFGVDSDEHKRNDLFCLTTTYLNAKDNKWQLTIYIDLLRAISSFEDSTF